MADHNSSVTATGQCLCGAVRYEVRGPLRPIIECHCKMCQRFSGGRWSSTAARPKDVTIEEDGALAWFRSSDFAKRGFCTRCGSSLFYKPDERDSLSLAAGSLDEPTGLSLAVRICTATAGDYYEIGDTSVPTAEDWPDPSYLKIPE